MAELGVAYISIVPDTSKLAAGIKGAAGPAADTAGQESGKRFGGRFSSAIGSALKTAGKAGLIGAGVAAGATILGGVKSAINQEKSEATLAGLYGSAKTASKLMKDLKKVASTSTIDYSTYAKAAEALAYMGIEGKDAPEMLENIGDAISGAGGGAEEMDRAGDALLKMVNAGKVQLDSLNQLSDAGVPIYSALASQQGESIQNVRKMVTEGKIGIEDVQSAIADAEGKSFKRQIKAAKEVEKTLSGRFAILKDNVMSSLGTMFRPGIEAASNFVGKVNAALFEGGGGGGILSRVKAMAAQVGSALQPLWNAAKGVFSAIGDAARDIVPALINIGKGLAPLAKFAATAAIGALVVSFRALAPVIRAVGKVIGWVGDFAKNHTTTFRVLAGVILGSVAAWKAFKVAQAAWAAAQAGYKSVIATMRAIQAGWNLEMIKTRVGLVALKVQTVAQAVAQRTAAAATKVWSLAQAAAAKVTALVRTAVNSSTLALARQRIATAATAVAQKAAAAGARVFAAAQWLVNAAMRANPIGIVITALTALGIGLVLAYKKSATFRKIVQGAWSGIKKAVSAAWGFIKPILRALWSFIQNTLGPIFKWLYNNVIKRYFQLYGKIISTAWNGVIKPIFKAISQVLRGDLSGAFNTLKQAASRAFNGVINAIKAVPGKIRDLAGKFKDAGKWLIEALINGLSKAGRFVSDIAGNVWDAVKGMLNAAIKKINDALDFKISIPGPDIHVNVPDIPQLARGGRVRRSTLALIGEGREAESVLPDSVLRGLLGRAHSGGVERNQIDNRRLFAAIRVLIDTLRGKVVPALLRRTPATDTTANRSRRQTRSAPRRRDELGSPTLKGFEKPFKKAAPTLKGFQQNMQRSRAETQRLNVAVKKGNNRQVRDWTRLRNRGLKPLGRQWTRTHRSNTEDAKKLQKSNGRSVKGISSTLQRFRRGSLKSFGQQWTRTHNSNANDAKRLNTVNSRQVKSVSSTLQRFRRGQLRGFSKDWGTTFRKKTPDDVSTFRKRTGDHMGGTRDTIRRVWADGIKPTLQTFGGYVKKTVAPAFGRGVDAIGKQWTRIKSKLRGPVKYVVSTVINGALIGAFNKIAKFVDAKAIKKAQLPKGFRTGGYTGDRPTRSIAGVVHGREFVINARATDKIRRTNPGFLERLNKEGLPGHREGGYVNPDKRVHIDGEPIAAVAASQLGLAASKLGRGLHLMQGGWQPATSYSGTSHKYPGVADTSPGTFSDQYWLRRVGFAAWARNIPGAHSAGSGAHVHSVSMLSPGTKGSSQIDAYKSGGDGLGGSDYGDRPRLIPNLMKLLSKFGPLSVGGGGIGAPQLPAWAQKIVTSPKKWAKGLLDGGDRLDSGFGGLVQSMLNTLIAPAAEWATSKLATFGGGAAGAFGPGASGIWQSLMSTGFYSKKQAAGVMGNMMIESGLVPNIVQGGGRAALPHGVNSGWGLVQWTPGYKVLPYLKGDGSISSQVSALTAQLRGQGPLPETKAGQKLKAAGSVGGATQAFGEYYERPASLSSTIAQRRQYAQGFYDRFASKKKFDDGGLARGIGYMRKDIIEPEMVLKPRDSRTFEQMVRANFRPATAGQVGRLERVEMVITNWDRGTGYIQGIAAQEDAANHNHARAMGALR